MTFRARSRALAMAGAAALGVLAAAPAASAAEPIGITADGAEVAVGSAGERVSLSVGAPDTSAATLTDVTLSVDTAALAGKATVNPVDAECTTAGTVVTCTKAALNVPTSALAFDIVPTTDAAVGDEGRLAWSVRAAELSAPLTTTSTVKFVKSIDLGNVPVGDGELSGSPGETVQFPLAVRNNAATPAEGVILGSTTSTGNVRYARRGSNCLYTDHMVACHFDQELLPATTYDLARSIAVTIRADSPAPYEYENSLEWSTVDDGQQLLELLKDSEAKRGTGAPLELTARESSDRKQADPAEDSSTAKFTISITGSNKADHTATGGTFRGAVGSKVTATVGIRNAGPARADYVRKDFDTLPGLHVVAPSNATVAAADPKLCVRAKNGEVDPAEDNPIGARELLCWGWTDTGAIEVGTTLTWEIGFRLTAATGTKGSVTVLDEAFEAQPTLDSNPRNNKAALTLAEEESDGNGGGDNDGTTDADESLPITGSNTGAIAGAGVALILLGTAAMAVTRRRDDTRTT